MGPLSFSIPEYSFFFPIDLFILSNLVKSKWRNILFFLYISFFNFSFSDFKWLTLFSKELILFFKLDISLIFI